MPIAALAIADQLQAALGAPGQSAGPAKVDLRSGGLALKLALPPTSDFGRAAVQLQFQAGLRRHPVR
jgi:hypothetical protein